MSLRAKILSKLAIWSTSRIEKGANEIALYKLVHGRKGDVATIKYGHFSIGPYFDFLRSKGTLIIGDDFEARQNFKLHLIDGDIIIGKHVFFNNNCSVVSKMRIEIGDNTIFGENVKIYDHNHRFGNDIENHVSRNEYNSAEINIGKNCWIGSNVIILKGVTIGDNVIVGANCVIYEDIEADTVVKAHVNLLKQKQV